MADIWVFVVFSICLVVDSSSIRKESPSAFRLANMFGDHMVLQMKPFSPAVWGFGEVGDTVSVLLNSEIYKTQVTEG